MGRLRWNSELCAPGRLLNTHVQMKFKQSESITVQFYSRAFYDLNSCQLAHIIQLELQSTMHSTTQNSIITSAIFFVPAGSIFRCEKYGECRKMITSYLPSIIMIHLQFYFISLLFLSDTLWDNVHVVIFRIDRILSAIVSFSGSLSLNSKHGQLKLSRAASFPSFRQLEIVAKSHLPVGWIGWVEVLIENWSMTA